MQNFVPGQGNCGFVCQISKCKWQSYIILVCLPCTIEYKQNYVEIFRKLIEIFDTMRGVNVDTIELYDLSYPCKISFCSDTAEVFILGKWVTKVVNKIIYLFICVDCNTLKRHDIYYLFIVNICRSMEEHRVCIKMSIAIRQWRTF